MFWHAGETHAPRLFQRHQIGEEVFDLLFAEGVDEAFGHETLAEELGGGDVLAFDASVSGTHLSHDYGIFVLADEEGIKQRAIFECSAVNAIAGFDRGIGGENVAHDGFGSHRTDGAEIGPHTTAGVAELVARDAESGKRFSGFGIAGSFGECEEALVFCIEGLGLFETHDRWHIERAD